MSRNEAKKIVKKYADKLVAANFPFESMYLFGSYATGKADKWSDIDVAIISNKIKSNWDKNTNLLWALRQDIDDRIEPHGFTVEEFKEGLSPMAFEVHRTGVRVA